PSFYENIHHNLVAGGQIGFSYYSGIGETSAGLELRSEQVNSSNLGQRSRETFGMYLEHKFNWSNFILVGGLVAYKYLELPWKIWPGVEVNYRPLRQAVCFISFNQSFRLPTFTELYYRDPVNFGNPQLKPEESRELETGLRYEHELFNGEISIFRRKAFNLIDWVKSSDSAPWQAENISEVNISGLEIGLVLKKELLRNIYLLDSMKINFAFYHSEKRLPIEYLSKYVLTGLKQQLILNLGFKKMLSSRLNLAVRCYQRLNGQQAAVVDGKILWTMKNFEFSIEGTNLLNKFYYDAGFLPAPGRWLIAGLQFKF
ncbi:MAG: TonB-dependent receptor domain-containing protein, partial [Candidatus Saccharicenans sp.]